MVSDMNASRMRADVLAGITTAFALAPECIAFALVAHLHPLMGLYGAFILCTITALFGGRPGMVSGAAGSMAVVIVALVVTATTPPILRWLNKESSSVVVNKTLENIKG